MASHGLRDSNGGWEAQITRVICHNILICSHPLRRIILVAAGTQEHSVEPLASALQRLPKLRQLGIPHSRTLQSVSIEHSLSGGTTLVG